MSTATTSQARPTNLSRGIGAALAGALAGALLWALVAAATDYKLGVAAIGVGALTGFLGGRAGGPHPALPAIAAGIALAGSVLGDFLINAHMVSVFLSDAGEARSSLDLLTHDLGGLVRVYRDVFEPQDAAFYAIAAVTAFRLATAMARRAEPAAPSPAADAPAAEPSAS